MSAIMACSEMTTDSPTCRSAGFTVQVTTCPEAVQLAGIGRTHDDTGGQDVSDDDGFADVGVSSTEVADGERVGEGLTGQRFGSSVSLGDPEVDRQVVIHQGACDVVTLVRDHRGVRRASFVASTHVSDVRA